MLTRKVISWLLLVYSAPIPSKKKASVQFCINFMIKIILTQCAAGNVK